MNSTMQDAPLTITELFRHGAEVFHDSEVVTFEGERARHTSFAKVAERAGRLAAGLRALGIGPGDRVATLCWNHQEHIEAYFAIPCMGAVLHTLNLRLPPPQLAQIINHAEDRVVIVDDILAPLLASVIAQCPSVEKVIVVGSGPVSGLGETLAYETLIEDAPATFEWPDIDERSAASMCYTTGTTGDPKGVVYSHRSVYLHSFAVWGTFRLDDNGRLLIIVPMFHVNAWGTPYAGWMVGSDLLLPGRFLQPEGLCTFIQQERPTFTGGVPTILTALLNYVQANGGDVSSYQARSLRWLGRSSDPDHRLSRRARHRVVAGMGNDRDEPDRIDSLPAQGHGSRGRDAVPREDRPCRPRRAAAHRRRQWRGGPS